MSPNLPQRWLDKAAEDLEVAHLTFDEEYFSHVCFLSQQAIEKTLKGFLLVRSGRYPRSHNLIELIDLCIPHEAQISLFRRSCQTIDQYYMPNYMPTRYPDSIPGGLPSGLPDQQEAKEAVEIATQIFQLVQKII